MDVRKFFIKPMIPDKISALHDLSFNLWSSWDKDAEKLFHRLDPQLFRNLNHNPVELLYKIEPERLKEVSKDKGFLYELKQVDEKFKRYLSFEGTYVKDGEEHSFQQDDVVVYICCEYGLHESVPIYSGGLAVLAGDQLKAASDVGMPMVGFGLLYRYGYFIQHITSDGNQFEEFKENTWYLSAVREVLDESGMPLTIEIPMKGEIVYAKIWKVNVGRVPLYLLDTNVHQNPPKYRKITDTLYDADRQTRLQQELVLGRGTVIALRALGIKPKVFHLNEGHTAFSIIERLIELVGQGYSFEDAKTIIRYSTIFTTHTPVVEGNEHFSDDLISEYLGSEVKALGLTMDYLLSLGKINKEKMFWLPAFAMRFSRHSNGVSKIHTTVSREMWKDLFPTMHKREVPIYSVTNGVHLQSWLSLQMTELLFRYVGPDFMHRVNHVHLWDKVHTIPDGEIWNAHRRRKEQVVSFIRRHVGMMMMQRGYGKNKIKDIEMVLNPDYLTIGFARRIVPYKRANLILHDPDRLVSIIKNKKRPVQFIFSGKSHPADAMGKGIIKQILDFISKYSLENHMVFIEDYDINIARHLVQGVDIWLNTPLKPMEASGTSGMKAGVNGILNLSVLDGWWPEAYNGENGWAIVSGGSNADTEIAKSAEANQIYELLENDITELYYERTESDVPVDWVKMMKNSIVSVCKNFSMNRAVLEYLYEFYLPQMEVNERVRRQGGDFLKKIADYRRKLDLIWPSIYIRDYFLGIHGRMPVSGEKMSIDSYVYLGDADRSLIAVEAFYCSEENGQPLKRVPLEFVEKYEDKVAKYSGEVVLEGSGTQEISTRIVPADADFREIHPDYIKWKD